MIFLLESRPQCLQEGIMINSFINYQMRSNSESEEENRQDPFAVMNFQSPSCIIKNQDSQESHSVDFEQMHDDSLIGDDLLQSPSPNERLLYFNRQYSDNFSLNSEKQQSQNQEVNDSCHHLDLDIPNSIGNDNLKSNLSNDTSGVDESKGKEKGKANQKTKNIKRIKKHDEIDKQKQTTGKNAKNIYVATITGLKKLLLGKFKPQGKKNLQTLKTIFHNPDLRSLIRKIFCQRQLKRYFFTNKCVLETSIKYLKQYPKVENIFLDQKPKKSLSESSIQQ